MNKIFHKIKYALIWVLSLLPIGFFYFLSDLVFVIIYYIIPYRKNVVYKNLKNSFPEKNENEIIMISRSFFHHFTDFMFENIKIINLSIKQHNKRYKYHNLELINNLYDKGKSIILVSGHYGNWEWMNSFPFFIKHKFMYVAKRLHSSFSDYLINKLRQKYGAVLVRMDDAYKTVLKAIKQNDRIILWLLADQRPPKNAEYWTTFLNQDTAFFLGAGKMVKKLDLAMVFLDIQKPGRGRYEVNFELLAESAGNLDEYQLTELHVKKLESVIRQKPDYWLWSHKRWKHKKTQEIR